LTKSPIPKSDASALVADLEVGIPFLKVDFL
jgi:hypothetical protein